MSSHFLPTPFPPFLQLPLLGLFLIPNPSLRLLSPLEPPGVAVVDATVGLLQSLSSCFHFLIGGKVKIAPLTQETRESKARDTSPLILTRVSTCQGKAERGVHTARKLLHRT